MTAVGMYMYCMFRLSLLASCHSRIIDLKDQSHVGNRFKTKGEAHHRGVILHTCTCMSPKQTVTTSISCCSQTTSYLLII